MTTKKHIDQLSIKGFKSIRNLENLNLHRLNVLIGGNGVGKSNFVDYFRMLSEMIVGRLQTWVGMQGGADRLLSYGIKETSILSSQIQFDDIGYSYSLEHTVDGKFIFTDESVYLLNEQKETGLLRKVSGNYEAFLSRQTNPGENFGTAAKCFSYLTGLKTFHFHDTSVTAGMKRWGSVHDNEFLRSDASNLAAYLYRLSQEHPDVLEEIQRTVRLGIPIFDKFVFKPRTLPTQEEQVNLQWQQKNSDYVL